MAEPLEIGGCGSGGDGGCGSGGDGGSGAWGVVCDDVGDLSAVPGDGGDGCTSGGVLGLLSVKPSLTDGEDADA